MRFLPILLLVAALSSPAASFAKQKAVKPRDQIEFGVRMAERGLWSEALFRFRQAERMGEASAAVLNNIAVAYEALGEFEQARDYYQRALDKDPRNSNLRRNYSRFVEFYQSFKPEESEADAAGAEADGDDVGEEGRGGVRGSSAASSS